MAINPYEVLGINPGATKDEIKSAYRKMAKNIIRIYTLTTLRPPKK